VEAVHEGRAGNLTTVVEPDPNNQPSGTLTTSYTYNWMKQVTQVSMPRGSTTQTRTFVYDTAGRLTSATNPENGTVTWNSACRSRLHELGARLGCRSDVPWQTGVASSNLIAERSAVSAVGECKQQEHDHGDDGHACAPADANSLLWQGMEIKSAGRFNRFVIGTTVGVHG